VPHILPHYVLHFLAPDVNWIPAGLKFKLCDLNFLRPSNIYSKVHNKHTFTYSWHTISSQLVRVHLPPSKRTKL